MRTRMVLGLCAALALSVGVATSGAGQASTPTTSLPAVRCQDPYAWCQPILSTKSGPGQASVAMPDTAFNPLGRSYSYLTRGTTLLAIRNVNDPTGTDGRVSWSWHAPTASVLLTAPTPVLLASNLEVVFVAGTNGVLYKLDAATGALLGAVDTRRLDDNGVVICPSDGVLGQPTVQLFESSGQAFRNAITAAGLKQDDLVYVGTADGCGDYRNNRIMAFVASTLQPFWTFSGTDSGDHVGRSVGGCTLDYASDTLFCGTEIPDAAPLGQDSLFVLDTLTGRARWMANAGSITQVLLAHGRLYVANRAGQLGAYRPNGDGLGGQWLYWNRTVTDVFAGNPGLIQDFEATDSGGLFILDSSGVLSYGQDQGDRFGVISRALPYTGFFTSLRLAVLSGRLYLYLGRSDGKIQQVFFQSGALDLQGLAWVAPPPQSSPSSPPPPSTARVAEPGLDTEADQAQAQIDASATLPFGGGSDMLAVAQTFTPHVSGVVSRVRLPVECKSGKVGVEITGVTGGVPNQTVYTKQEFDASAFPQFSYGRPRLRSLDFINPPVLSTRTVYAIVLLAGANCDVNQGPTGDPYTRGSALTSPAGISGPWTSAGSHDDLAFQTQGSMRLVVGDDQGDVTRLIPPLVPDSGGL